MLSWHQTRNGLTVTGLGEQDLLNLPMTAFFASRQCPGSAIRAAMNWAFQQAQAKNVVISGFHSTLEQSVLKVLIEARSPVVVVLARPVDSARLPPEWGEQLKQRRMAVVSATISSARLTRELAAERNNLVTQLATKIVVTHASIGGALADLCSQLQAQGRQIIHLSNYEKSAACAVTLNKETMVE